MNKERKTYEAPQLRELGSVTELTKDYGGWPFFGLFGGGRGRGGGRHFGFGDNCNYS